MPDDSATRHQQFAELFVRHQRRVYGYCLTVVANANDADEVFSETSLVLWKKVDQYDFSADFTAWACGVARNVIRNWRVKIGRDRHLFSEEFVAQLSAEREEHCVWLDDARSALQGCLEKLNEEQRSFLQRCYGGDESFVAVALLEGKTEAATYQQLSRIRRRLLKCIQGDLQEDSP